MNAKADLAKLRAARNRASKAYRERLKAAGKLEVRELLDAADIERLDQLAEVHGSRAKALSALIRGAAPVNAAVWKAGDVAEPTDVPASQVRESSKPARKVLAKAGPVTDIKTGATRVDLLVGPAPVAPGSRLKAKK